MNSVVKLAMVTMIALLALMVVHAEPDDAAISYFESDGNTYEVVGDGQVSLTRTENADLYVPASVYDSNSGIEYSVVSVDTFRNDNLRTVVIEYGIESVFINAGSSDTTVLIGVKESSADDAVRAIYNKLFA